MNLFNAQAQHHSLPNGKVSGQIELTASTIIFRPSNPELTQLVWQINHTQFSLGGASNRLVFIKNPYDSDWDLYSSDPALLQHPMLLSLKQEKTKKSWLSLSYFFMALVLMGLLGIVFWLSLDGFSKFAAKQVPSNWEQSLGKTVFKQYEISAQLMPKKESDQYLLPVVNPLLEHVTKEYQQASFYIVNDPSINAFALPGGIIVVHSGLIVKAENAAQLQGVLGHELSHVTQQHGLRSMIRTMGLLAAVQALFGDASGIAAIATQAGPTLMAQKYSRDFEREADQKGLALLQAAQINPIGMVEFFQIMKKVEHEKLQKIVDKDQEAMLKEVEKWLSSHPATDERIDNLQNQIKEIPQQQWRDDQATFLKLKKEVSQFVIESKKSAQETATGEDK